MTDKGMDLAQALEQTESRFLEIAPQSINYQAEKGFAIQVLRNNSYLKKAAYESPVSLQQAIINVAAIGLSLNPAEKLAYLLPRNVKVGPNQWQTRIFLEPSYMGLIRLATNSGSIEWVQAAPYFADDKEVIDNGPGEKPTHIYDARKKASQRGEFEGVYCVAKTATGDYLTTFMDAETVYGIRDRSEAWKQKQSGPWRDDFYEMAKKAVIRRAFKTWPLTDERAAHAIELSNVNEGFEPILTSPNINQYTADQKDYFDQMIESGNSLGMFVYQRTLDNESLFTNLYHSFEKGSKGKFQRVVDSLLSSGREKAESIIVDLESSMQSNDDVAAMEIWESLSEDERKYIKLNISIESQAFINELTKPD